ncbi:MAG: hypothetical protein GF313_01730, partial [Caldithrix sp.]|nr:hypothetical protein [Caldithrix sp.]
MNSKFNFDRYFGLSWFERLDGTYWSIFVMVSLGFLTAIIILAQIDYHSLKADIAPEIRQRYVSFVSDLVVQEDTDRTSASSLSEFIESSTEPETETTSAEERRRQRSQIQQNILDEETIFGDSPLRSAPYDYLPEVDDLGDSEINTIEVVELSHLVERYE